MSRAIRLDGMVLTLTERCNLRCQYCYVPVARGRTMTPEIADRAVDLLLEHAADGGDLTLSFFGGEPFLAADLMRRTVARARAGVRPGQTVRVLTPTNGLALSDDDLGWREREQIELAISIDGVAEEGPAASEDIPTNSVRKSDLSKIIEVFVGGRTPLRPRTSMIARSCLHRQDDLEARLPTLRAGTR